MTTNIYTANKRLSALKILMIAIILMGVGRTHAQSINELARTENKKAGFKHEVSGHLKGPFSGLQSKHDQDKSSLKKGLGFGVNYRYYLNSTWSLSTGLELQKFKGEVSYNFIEDAYQTTDSEGEEFEFRYAVQDLTEEQSASYLNIPVKLQYEGHGKIRFYAAGGVKIGMHIKSEHETSISTLKTSGYYSQYDAELHAPQFMGFGEFTNIKSGKKELNGKTNLAIEIETGLKFITANNRAFYVGLFLDYGLNNIIANNYQQNLVSYNSEDPTAFISESILTSANKKKGSAYVDKTHTLAYGLKIQYAFSL
jgi:hypothetical protein